MHTGGGLSTVSTNCAEQALLRAHAPIWASSFIYTALKYLHVGLERDLENVLRCALKSLKGNLETTSKQWLRIQEESPLIHPTLSLPHFLTVKAHSCKYFMKVFPIRYSNSDPLWRCSATRRLECEALLKHFSRHRTKVGATHQIGPRLWQSHCS